MTRTLAFLEVTPWFEFKDQNGEWWMFEYKGEHTYLYHETSGLCYREINEFRYCDTVRACIIDLEKSSIHRRDSPLCPVQLSRVF